MTINAAQLLKRLEPAVRPGPSIGPDLKPPAALETQSFDQLLSLASKGAVHSGRQIELAFEPLPPLESAQLERLAAAADQAQAAGAKRALMLIDGRGFVLDVASRTLIAELASDPAARLVNIDAAVFVANDDESIFDEALGPPVHSLIPPAVLKQISSKNQAIQAGQSSIVNRQS